jgi:hypothetical protein
VAAVLAEAASFSSLRERRFLLNALIPSLAFSVAVLFMASIGTAHGITGTLRYWSSQAGASQAVLIFAFVTWVAFFSVLLAAMWQWLMHLYQGYWPSTFHWLAKRGVRHQQARLLRLYEQGNVAAAYSDYPYVEHLNEVRPTRLGNIIRSAELYPFYRYNAESVILGPRMQALFPESYLKVLEEAASSLEFLLVIATLGGFFSISSGLYLLITNAPWWIFLACFWGGFVLAIGAYSGSLNHARTYAEQLRSGFDLYRTELLKQMRLPLPDTLEEERELWESIGLFMYRNFPPDWSFTREGSNTDVNDNDAIQSKMSTSAKADSSIKTGHDNLYRVIVVCRICGFVNRFMYYPGADVLCGNPSTDPHSLLSDSG